MSERINFLIWILEVGGLVIMIVGALKHSKMIELHSMIDKNWLAWEVVGLTMEALGLTIHWKHRNYVDTQIQYLFRRLEKLEGAEGKKDR